MKESLRAMNDLSDDEQSPRYQFTEAQVLNDIGEAQIAYYSVAMGLFGHLRHGDRQRGEANESNENNENEESEDMEEDPERRYYRYLQADLSDVSDPQ